MTGNIIGFKHFCKIFKYKYINQAVLIKNLYHLKKFFRTVINVLIMTLYMHIAGCQIIYTF